jgi:hypothetical protein
MDKPEVDTTDTTQTVIETPAVPDADTIDTANPGDLAPDYLKNVFGSDKVSAEDDNSVPEDTVSEEEPGTDEDAPPEEPVEDTKPVNVVFELDDNGKVETIDVSTEEGKAKAEKYMKAGRYVERVRHEQKEKETNLNQLATSLAYQTLYLQSKGNLKADDFMEKPFEHFDGKGTDENDDVRLWNEHKREVNSRISQLNEFTANQSKTAQQFNSIVEKFAKDHPEITDVQDWINKNVLPYHEPIFTYGNKPYPEDTLENIYFAKNKDKIIKAEVDKALKDYVKKPVVKKTTPQQIRTNTTERTPEDMAREGFNKIVNPYGRKLVG